jgi:protein SCO1/2
MLAACGAEPGREPARAGVPAGAKTYSLRGTVVAVDTTGRSLTVNHGEIPGFMPAMTMNFPVLDPTLLERLSPGERIAAEVVVAGDVYWLEKIAPDSPAEGAK